MALRHPAHPSIIDRLVAPVCGLDIVHAYREKSTTPSAEADTTSLLLLLRMRRRRQWRISSQYALNHVATLQLLPHRLVSVLCTRRLPSLFHSPTRRMHVSVNVIKRCCTHAQPQLLPLVIPLAVQVDKVKDARTERRV